MSQRPHRRFSSRQRSLLFLALTIVALIAAYWAWFQIETKPDSDLDTTSTRNGSINSHEQSRTGVLERGDEGLGSRPTNNAKQQAQPTWTIQQIVDESIEPIQEDPSFAMRRRLVWVDEISSPIIIEHLISVDRPLFDPQLLSSYSANRLLVKSTLEIPVLLEQLEIDKNWNVIRRIGKGDYYLIGTEQLSLDEFESTELALVDHGAIAQVERDLVYYTSSETVPNDLEFARGLQWGLDNPLENGFDINAVEGWTLRTDSRSVIVAIIDSGVNLTHEDLVPNLWINFEEIPDNGIDDDGNGYVDDIFGINTLNNISSDVSDDNGHGTHVAGIIGAKGNNNLGISGVAWEAQLMTIKSFNENGRSFTSANVEAIDYASHMRARVINASWGGPNYSASIKEAIERARDAGAAFVAAAGNESYNLNSATFFPAQYEVDNLVSVAAMQRNGTLANFSNFGTRDVDIAAPGAEILSAWIGSEDAYITANGTSMAAPFVSGALALLFAEYPSDSPAIQIARLITSGSISESIGGKIRTGRIPDLNAALAMESVPFPPMLTTPLSSTLFADQGDPTILRVEDESKGLNETAYQWFHNGTPLANQTSLELEVISSELTAGTYRIVATNSDGSDEISFDLRVFVSQPELGAALDSPEAEFLADTGHEWIVYEDDQAIGGLAIRKSVSRIEGPDELRLKVTGPGEVRMIYRQFSIESRFRFEVRNDGNRIPFYPTDRWEKATIPIPKIGPQVISWRTDNYFDQLRSHMGEIAIDSIVFYPIDILPPNIGPYWGNRSFREGSNLDLRFDVYNDPTQFQWFKDGALFKTTDIPRLRIENVDTTAAGTYRLVASNANGSDQSEPVEVEITPGPPRFLDQDGEIDIRRLNEGDSVVLAPEYTGSFELEFQWYHYSDPIPGANNSTLVIDPVTLFDHGRYRLEIWYPSTGESARSEDLWLEVRPAQAKPAIHLSLHNRRIYEEGQTIDLFAESQGSDPISFQWYRDNAPILGATNESLQLENATLADEGIYYLVAQNEFGFARSVDTEITMFSPPNLTELLDGEFEWIYSGADIVRPEFGVEFKGGGALRMQPRSQYSSSYYSLNFNAQGPGTLRMKMYTAPAIHKSRYREDRMSISVGDTSTGIPQLEDGWLDLSLPMPEGTQHVSLLIRREDAEYFLFDDFRVDPAPVIFQPPLDATTEIGEETNFKVVVQGQGDLAFQWYKDNFPIEGATDSEYTILNTQSSDHGIYHVTVASEHGLATSGEATLSVIDDLESLLDLEQVAITSGGDASWSLDLETLILSSGSASPPFVNWIEFELIGPTYFNFDYIESGTGTLLLDGDWYDHLSAFEEWTTKTVVIPEGSHKVRVEYNARTDTTQPIFIRNPRLDSHPEFKVHPRNFVSPSLIQDHTLSAEVYWPIPINFQWYKDGVEIPEGYFPEPSKIYTEIVVGGNSGLGPGIYHCEAVYPGGEKAVSRPAIVEHLEGVIEALSNDGEEIDVQSEYSVDWTLDDEIFLNGGSSLRIDSNSIFEIIAPAGGALTLWAKTEGLTDLNTLETSSSFANFKNIERSHDWRRFDFLLGEEYEFERKINIWARFLDDRPATLWLDNITFSQKPFFKRHPESIQSRLGEAAILSPTIHSIHPVSYQWLKDGSPIHGARSGTLIIDPVTSGSFGAYQLVATNSAGSITSDSAILSESASINQALDAPNLSIQSGGHGIWGVSTDEWQYDGSAIISPPLEIGQIAFIEFQVSGPVDVGFFAKPIEGTERAFAQVYVDGDRSIPFHSVKAWDNGWNFNSFHIGKSGPSTVRIETSNTENSDPEVIRMERLLIDRLHFRYPTYSSYSSWAEDQLLNKRSSNSEQLDLLEDADSNGIPNLVEYLLVESQTRNNGPFKINRIVVNSEESHYLVRAAVRRDFQYAAQLEYSSNLKNWKLALPFLSEESDTGTANAETFDWKIYAPIDEPIFIRWKISGPEAEFRPF